VYKCCNCGEEFEEPEVIKEFHGFHDGMCEKFYVCPFCGDDEIEIIREDN